MTSNAYVIRVNDLLDQASAELAEERWFDALLNVESALKLVAVELRGSNTTALKDRSKTMLDRIWNEALFSWNENERLVQVRWLLSMC